MLKMSPADKFNAGRNEGRIVKLVWGSSSSPSQNFFCLETSDISMCVTQ